ncbi:hypothetical protein ABB37_06907 [Leptomonas pyrrhocoris]|uniref:Uncharacterized protein n=1 Tax=Leptomonas pyrrhocoris TaxID=157538 RepID=A0A0M9FWQ8_LEPPY|nr:hypothetical protein ABB37_06907 [Leptomonas pyrrhocoris]KPA77527.1 hypothetical protein ABB37_06907 [Leptomonas pyrrhocoris]|eukprot:XP_015655966.1 hypothetical protein ABB37_06907 [Leptomonas pyrrhocoris]
MFTSTYPSNSSSRDRHRRGHSGGGSADTNKSSGRGGGGMLLPDNLAATPATPTSATGAGGGGGGGSRLQKKSPHMHVTMAASVKGNRGGSPHAAGSTTATAGGGGVATTLEAAATASINSASGVAPQRGMRRPMSAYSLVNDSLTASFAGLSSSAHGQGHRTGSPLAGPSGGAANTGTALESRRASHVKSSNSGGGGGAGGPPTGPTTQVQNTSTGSTRRQTPSNSPGSVAILATRSSKSSHSASSRTAPLQQQQQQSQNTTGAATCVGIATNVLMHLLRGALNGCTTINMVNCTFLVFPLILASSWSASLSLANTTGNDVNHSNNNSGGGGGGSTYGASALDQQRQPSRSATALLVVAMKQPDTDAGAIANFAQCFVNILCREEQRCRYVSAELDRMEALTNHWVVGGGTAVAKAAADMRPQQQQLLDLPLRQTSSFSMNRAASCDGGGLHGMRGSTSPQLQHSRADSSSGVLPSPLAAAVASPLELEKEEGSDATRTYGDYDYLFAPARLAVRGSKAANVRGNSNSSVMHRTSSHGGHAGAHGAAPPMRTTAAAAAPATAWVDAEDDAEGEEAAVRRGAAGSDSGGNGGGVTASPTRAPSPLTGREGGGGQRRRGGGPPAPSILSPTSLYQQLATYVGLAAEVQQVAQCIDLWNRTSRGVEGGRRLTRLSGRGCVGRPTSAAAAATTGGQARNGNAAAPRDSFHRSVNGGASSQQQQQQQQSLVTAAPGEVLDALPDAILVNQLLLLPMSHLTGQERLELAQTTRSAYSRIHPCSVITVAAGQFTADLQRSYTDMMGRRYAKLIPLATVYTLLMALPSPRRAGSLYRSIELTLLEAVQRRHARSVAAAAAASATATAPTTATPTVNIGSTNFSAAHTSSAGSFPAHSGAAGRSSWDAVAEEEPPPLLSSSSAVAAAAATTVAGLDFLAMEIIDFLRVHGAISVASEMWVSFTHGEVTPVEYVEAAVVRRRRHRLRAERRRQRATATVASSSFAHHGRHKDRQQLSDTQVPGPEQQQGRSGAVSGVSAVHEDSSSWASSEATTMAIDSSHSNSNGNNTSKAAATDTRSGTGTASSAEDPFDAVKDMDTVPAALVLHMLERVVDAQHSQQQQQQMQGLPSSSYVPIPASVMSLNGSNGVGGSRCNGADAETASTTTTTTTTTTGMPKSPSTGNTIPAAAAATTLMGGGTARTPRSSETDVSVMRAAYKVNRPLDALAAGHARAAASSVQQQQLVTAHPASATASAASSPPLLFIVPAQSGRGATSSAAGGVAPNTSSGNSAPPPPQQISSPAAQLSVYCAWGSACPLCEQLASHPQCWTTAANRDYTVGYYVMSAAHHLRSAPVLHLNFPSLDASVRTCACHARRMRDHVDMSSLMQNSYNISGGGSLAGQRAGSSSSGSGGGGGLLHSLQPWFIRPHMFVTPVTAAYGVSPFEIFERLSYHTSHGGSHNDGGPLRQQQQRWTALGGPSAAGVPLVVPVNNTSSLVEPERRDILLLTRTQAHQQEASEAASRRGATVGVAEEQGHTLLQCADIPAGAVDFLRRNAKVIRRRLAYARAQQTALARFEQACERRAAAHAKGFAAPPPEQTLARTGPSSSLLSASAVGAAAAAGSSGRLGRHVSTATSPSAEDARSEATTTTTATTVVGKSAAVSVTSPSTVDATTDGAAALPSAPRPVLAASTQPMPLRSAAVEVDNEPHASSPLLGPAAAALSKLSSSADARPRSLRYGRRQLPLHTATSPLTNVNLLLYNATPTAAAAELAVEEERPQREERPPSQQPQQQQLNSGSATNGFPFAGVGDLLDGGRSLPVEVLLQYILHHLIALSWGRRGVEVDTLVRLLERNLRRLPPLLANLQYVRQLRNAGFTSESAAVAVAALHVPAAAAATTAAATTNTASPDVTAAAAPASSSPSAVFTTVHTRLAAASFSVGGGSRPSPSALTDTAEEAASDTSPYSGCSRAATAMPVSESEVQLLQAYEVLEKLSLMELLAPYATWPVRTVPTRLLLHTVVNEFSDVLYVDGAERDEEADHWDLPVAAQ